MAAKLKNAKPVELPKSFDELVRLLPPMAIRDDIQHDATVEMIDQLMGIENLSRGQSDYLETLVELVEAYEAKHDAIDTSGLTGVEMLKFILEQAGMSGADLARALSIHPTMGSKLLNRERRLTWDHAKILAARFKVDPALFMD
jgi:antitoxin component HigA of HigAB toxin-antitoxin module